MLRTGRRGAMDPREPSASFEKDPGSIDKRSKLVSKEQRGARNRLLSLRAMIDTHTANSLFERASSFEARESKARVDPRYSRGVKGSAFWIDTAVASIGTGAGRLKRQGETLSKFHRGETMWDGLLEPGACKEATSPTTTTTTPKARPRTRTTAHPCNEGKACVRPESPMCGAWGGLTKCVLAKPLGVGVQGG